MQARLLREYCAAFRIEDAEGAEVEGSNGLKGWFRVGLSGNNVKHVNGFGLFEKSAEEDISR